MARPTSPDYLSIAYALTVTLGGAVGYAKAGSVASLAAGVGFGAALGFGAYQLSRDPQHYQFALVTTLMLASVMGARYYRGGKFMPAGLIFSLSMLNAARLGVRTISG